MGYGDFKDLQRRTASDIALRHKAFNIAKNSKYDTFQRELFSMVFNFQKKIDKTSSSDAGTSAWSEVLATQNKPAIKSEIMSKSRIIWKITQVNY